MRRLIKRLLVWWEQLNTTTHDLPHYILQALTNVLQHGSSRAASLAYYAVFSVFPLTLLLAVGVSSLVGPAVAQEQIARGLELFLPPDTVALIQENLTEALRQGTSFGVIAVLGLSWSALGLFSNITWSLDHIFQVPSFRSLWRQRLLAFFMSLTLVVLVLASFVTSGVLRLVSALLLERPNIWVTIGILFLPLGLDVVIFALLFRYVPARHVYWDAVWPAALIGSIGWEAAKTAFGWYLTNLANYQFVYGGIATGIVLLFWAYLIAWLFLLSAELCARLNEWLIEQKNREAERILTDDHPVYLSQRTTAEAVERNLPPHHP